MRLITNDQIHVSAVQADPLRPGQEFEVHEDLGKTLLAAHPGVFSKVKMAKTVKNKDAGAPSKNKGATSKTPQA